MELSRPLEENEILVLRDVKLDMTSHDGFVWPVEGPVEAPDWKNNNSCGNGLHGLPWGVGGIYAIGGKDAVWLVVRVRFDIDYQHGTGDMTDKCKFARGWVEFVGLRDDAVRLLIKYAPENLPINYLTQTAGHASTQTAGYRSTQTAGHDSIQTAGDASTQTAGHDSTQTAGDASTQTAGHDSIQTAGHDSIQTAGNRSTQTAGDASTQTVGDASIQTAGIDTVQITRWWDGKWKVATRIVVLHMVNKPYCVKKGVWELSVN